MIESFVNWFAGDFVLTFIAAIIVMFILVAILGSASFLGYLLDERAKKENLNRYHKTKEDMNNLSIIMPELDEAYENLHTKVKGLIKDYNGTAIQEAKKSLMILNKQYPWYKRLSPLYRIKKKNLKLIIKVAKMR